MINFLGEEIKVGKLYVYLKNERTGSSTVRKLKMIGICVGNQKYPVFQRKCCEGIAYLRYNSVIEDKVYNSEDVICEYAPTEEQWIKELEE